MPYVVFSDETKAYFNYCSINKCRSLNVQKTMSSPIFIVSVLRSSCLLYSFQPPSKTWSNCAIDEHLFCCCRNSCFLVCD